MDSWYAWVAKGHGDDIIVSYDYHVCWDGGAGVNGRGHTTERHDAYYMVFDTKEGTWRNIKNETLNLPITREVADDKTLVARTGDDNWTFNGSTHLDAYVHPHIAMNIGKDLGEKTGGPKQTSYFKWDGNHWIGGNVVNPQSRIDNTDSRGDFIIKSPNEVSFALGYQDKNDGVIAYWNSTNGGKSFNKGQELLRRKGANWALTSIIQNSHTDARLIVAEKLKGSNWRKIYLLGDSGPIQRAKIEAQVLNK
jgi:hypothetical protein